jgi:Transcription initiation factor TFIIIB, Brf1 subunit/Transcription initiation factor TFIIB
MINTFQDEGYRGRKVEAKEIVEDGIEELGLDDYSGPTTTSGYKTPEDYAMACVDVAFASGIAKGRMPKSIAAGALYMAGLMFNRKSTQKRVAEVTGSSPSTIYDSYDEIYKEIYGV